VTHAREPWGDRPLVVYLPYPGLHAAADEGRLRAIHPRVELVTQPTYTIPHAEQLAREDAPYSEEVRATATPLTDDQRAAFGRAHVVCSLNVPVDLPALAPNLRWIQAIGSGVGQYVASRLPEGGIVLTNSAGVGAPAIAEWTMGRILQILKRFPEHDAAAKEHRWSMAHGAGLAGRTLAIVGVGAIGRAVAVRARAFGMHLVGVRRSWTPGATDPDVDELHPAGELHAVLGRADVVVLAATGVEGNAHLFDAAAFAAMRPGSVFVNVARGMLVDEEALIAALRSGHLSAAATDVAAHEPMPADDPLWDAPNLLISPHSSAGDDRYGHRVMELFYANLERFVAGEPLVNVIDLTHGY
jgi:phosphoglycerate dehydrogenase-like enzyme